jgi:hypothetical protein
MQGIPLLSSGQAASRRFGVGSPCGDAGFGRCEVGASVFAGYEVSCFAYFVSEDDRLDGDPLRDS